MIRHDPEALRKQAAQRKVSQLRREAGRTSLYQFAKSYLPAHFSIEPSRMHMELNAQLENSIDQRGLRLAIAAPRGHAKSTIVSNAFILWCICYDKEPFILLISNTIDQATDSLSHIKTELQSNPRLLEDFPEVCEPPGIIAGAPRWRKDEIITRNGVKVTALGTEKKFRGKRHKEHRPTLIILDDVENEVEMRSADQRKFKLEWFNKTVLKCGTAFTNVIVVGTILHYDSLLCGLLDRRKSPGWAGRKYQAVTAWATNRELWATWESIYFNLEQVQGRNGPKAALEFFNANQKAMLEGTDVLWPQREDYYSLMELRLNEGRGSFDSEKQNEPVNPDDCYFQESDFQFWDDQYGSVEDLIASCPERPLIYGACDPSMGNAGRNGDDSAIISLLKKGDTFYVIDADIARRKPDKILEDIIAYQRIRGYVSFGIEGNQFQKFLADEARRRSNEAGLSVPVRDITSVSDKLGRIQRLQPFIKGGKIRFSRRHTTLMDQLRQFPMGAHDDGPDALEMALTTAIGPHFDFRIIDTNGDNRRRVRDDTWDERHWTTMDL